MAIENTPKSASGAKLVVKGKADHFRKQESRVENINYMIGKNVWIKVDSEELFAEATVVSVEADNVCVLYNGENVTLPITNCLNNLDDVEALEISDLVKIPHANSAVVLDILKSRFAKDVIYTYAGKLLVVLNPFKLIQNLYSESTIKKYSKSDTTLGFPPDLDPHTYAVAQCAMNGLVRNKKSQSCIVSGESGAGKTETAKQLMSFFAYGQTKVNNRVQDIILGTNALLESFGNAKTLNNNNSSRFGKFIKLLLEPNGGICGGIISSYMLELSRIDFQNENERSYHIFYQCVKGLTQAEKADYGFLTLDDYKFINKWKYYDAPGIDDVKNFEEVKKQLKILFNGQDYHDFFKCISGILLSGNIEFVEECAMGVDNAAKIKDEELFVKVCTLLGFDVELARNAFTRKVVTIQGSDIESPVTVLLAEVNAKAMAKDLYGALFEYCIDSVNKVITFNDVNNNWLGILDIYGFEYFKYNTYEQLLINYANERLQQYFINQVFQSEIKIYDEEGIDHSFITFSDNSTVLQIFDKPNQSIFSFLEEQCLIQTGTYEKFTQSCKSKIKNDLFIPSKGEGPSFTIVHTAATVTYNTEEFVVKNKHKLSAKLIELLRKSTNTIVSDASKKIPNETGNMKGKFMGSTFQKSIISLMNCLETTDPHFIRCIKTNQKKLPNLFETKNVYDQLISLSILEAIQTIHHGFAYKATFNEFIKDNELVSSMSCDSAGDIKENVKGILEKLNIPPSEYQIGKTKLFLRKNGWIMLEQQFLQFTSMMKPLGDVINNYYTVYLNKKIFSNVKALIIRLQSNIRSFIIHGAKIKYRKLSNDIIGLAVVLNYVIDKGKKERAATCIQSFVRMYTCRKEYLSKLEERRKELIILRARTNIKKFKTCTIAICTLYFFNKLYNKILQEKAATKIAATWRMHSCINAVNNMRLFRIRNFAATHIQKSFKRYSQVKKYKYLKLVTPHAVTIQAHVRGYLARKEVDSATNGVTVRIRGRLKRIASLQLVQNFIRTFNDQKKLETLYNDVTTLQTYASAEICYRKMVRILEATRKIKSAWKRYKHKSIIQYEKDKLILQSKLKFTESITISETTIATKLLEGHKSSSNAWLPVHVNVSAELTRVYGNGWSRTLSSLMDNGTITSISMGEFHTVVVLDNFRVYTFGLNRNHQLGVRRSILDPITTITPTLLVKNVQCGMKHSLLLLSDGSLYSWGCNSNGQCGIGNADVVPNPTLVRFPLVDGKPQVVLGMSAGHYHTGVVTLEGNAFVFGKGWDINLPNVVGDVRQPLEVFPRGSSKGIVCSKSVTFVLSRKDTVYSFGNTYNGQIGCNHPSTPCHPLQLNLSNITSLDCGPNFTIALDTLGKLYQWGTVLVVSNEHCHTKEIISKPTEINLQGTAINSFPVKVSIGWWETNVLTDDGKVWGWSYYKRDQGLKPILYKYSVLEKHNVKDIHVIASPTLTTSLAKL